MNILITGGAGYIGSHVVKALLQEKSHHITIIDNLSTGFPKTIETLQTIFPFEFVNLDLSDWQSVSSFFKEHSFDAVIHFSASLIVPESLEKPLDYYLNNTANAANLLKECVKHNINNFIFSSTAVVYQELPIDKVENGLSENFPLMPINPYGHSKLFIEQIIQDTAKAYPSFKYVILRYFNVAGADKEGLIGQSTANATHLIKVAAQAALGKREKMFIFGDDYATPDGTCIRDYIDVDDLALAHIQSLEYLENGKSDIFNCGYGKGFSVKEVLETMKCISGVDFKVEVAPRREGDPAVLIANSDKIKTQMGWKPRYNDLALICQKALEWEQKL